MMFDTSASVYVRFMRSIKILTSSCSPYTYRMVLAALITCLRISTSMKVLQSPNSHWHCLSSDRQATNSNKSPNPSQLILNCFPRLESIFYKLLIPSSRLDLWLVNIWSFNEKKRTSNRKRIKQFSMEREVGTRQLNYRKITSAEKSSRKKNILLLSLIRS